MPRGKKVAKELSPEEKLEQALVPDWERPYKVPENWCWIHLLDSFENHTDSKKKVQSKNYLETGKLAVVDQGQVLVCGYTDNENMTYSGQLPVIIFGDHTRCVKYIDFPFAQGADGVKVLSPKSFYDVKAFYFALQSIDIPNMGYRRHYPLFSQFSIPVPPFLEQQRIVERIESLFAKLEEVKEKAQAVMDGFELRKSAILHKAFTGELTERWRKEHGVRPDSWTERNIQSVCAMKITDGTHKTPTYCENGEGIPFISAKDVTSGKICWDNIKYIIPELHEELYQRLAPQLDDVLLAKNGTTGVAAIVEEEKIFDLYVTLAVLRPDKEVILPRYLLNIVNSPVCKRQFDEHLTGIGVPNLHLRDIKEVLIAVPSLEEQAEVVRIVDKLMENEQRAKEAAEAVLDQIDTMKKAILARAFRGELGTNNPAEESAVELVKQVFEKSDEVISEQKVRAKRVVIPAEIKSALSNVNEEEIIRVLMKSAPEAVSMQTIMSISKKKFELMDALRSLEKKQLIIRTDAGEYLLAR